MDMLHEVDPADEYRHTPGTEPYWGESIYLDLSDASGTVGAYVRLGLYPNQDAAWWTAAVSIEGRGPIVSAIYDFPVEPGTGFTCGRGADHMRYLVHEELGSVQVLSTTMAKRYEQPADPYDDALGEPVRMDLDLTWETVGTPYHYAITTRYEIPCRAKGTITIDGEVFSVEGPAQRDHSWGVRDWWAHGWCWSALHFDDGVELHAADIRIDGAPPLGYVQRDGGCEPISTLTVTEVYGNDGLPTVAHMVAEPGGLDVEITPYGYGILKFVKDDGRIDLFPRSMVRCVRSDGVKGLGWIEWNLPQAPV